ncbi:MAG TPA: hypothetical protein VGM41_10800 [Chitinophagaceae bacterium]
MVTQSKGKIFLAEERGLCELDWFRTYNTFNFGQYYNEYKVPFGPLYVLNEDTLGGGKSMVMTMEDDSDIILLPVVGALDVSDGMGHTDSVEAGQALLLDMPKGASVDIRNPYETSLVKYLQLWMKKNPGKRGRALPRVLSFDLGGNPDRLIDLFSPTGSDTPDYTCAIGKFRGREETVYKIKGQGHGLFVFVIEGVFEVQYRLLHAGDGLALWDIQEAELEALSNDAIILLLELPLSLYLERR